MQLLAFDVSKETLSVFDGSTSFEVGNATAQIEKLLALQGADTLVCEPTGRYHLELVEVALRLDIRVYLVNPREAKHYKEAFSFRAKTDELDARYLYDYASRNEDLLRPYEPPLEDLAELRALLTKRQTLVAHRASLAQSLGTNLKPSEKDLLEGFGPALEEMERDMEELAQRHASYALVRSVPGVGKIVAAALVSVLETKHFTHSKELVAFTGLDVRIRQSGKYKGKTKLTKRGDPTLRQWMCMAGQGLLNSRYGKDKRRKLIEQRRQFPERMAIAARKILRTVFAIYQTQTPFDPQKWKWA